MSKKINTFLNKKFNTKVISKSNLIGRQRINIIFKINKKGEIIDIQSRAPHPSLEKETERVIGLLPKMIKPGITNGKPVTSNYSLPIIFDISEGKKHNPFKTAFPENYIIHHRN